MTRARRAGLSGQAADIAGGDQTSDSVMRTTRQLARVTIRTGQIESSKNFHDLLGKLQGSLPGSRRVSNAQNTPGRDTTRWIPVATDDRKRRTHDRHRSVFVAVSGQTSGRLRSVSHGRRHSSPMMLPDGTVRSQSRPARRRSHPLRRQHLS